MYSFIYLDLFYSNLVEDSWLLLQEMAISSIIFDFDGTLTPLNLNFDILKAEILKIARAYVREEKIKESDGFYVIETIYELEKGLDTKGGEFVEKAFQRLKELELEAARGKDLYPYTREILSALKGKRIKLGIITRSCMDVLKCVFPDIHEYMDGVTTREHIRLVKPHPSHVTLALRILDSIPQEAMLVGDHPTDIIAGNLTGLITVGVLTGRTLREDFKSVGATHIVQDIRDIIYLI